MVGKENQALIIIVLSIPTLTQFLHCFRPYSHYIYVYVYTSIILHDVVFCRASFRYCRTALLITQYVCVLQSMCSDVAVLLSCPLLCFTVCPGPPEAPTLVSGVPPNAAVSWSPPSASGAWSYMYEVSWTNGSNIVPRQAGTTAQITGLQAETQYTMVITAFPVSTLCSNKSTAFTFMTTQSE